MSIRIQQCDICASSGRAYCEHRGVLVVWMDGAQIAIRGETEQRARAVADRLSLGWRGRRFYSSAPKAEQQRGAA